LDAALKVYKARSGIEAMFKDCKSGGYNLEVLKSVPHKSESTIPTNIIFKRIYEIPGKRQRLNLLNRSCTLKVEDAAFVAASSLNFLKSKLLYKGEDLLIGFDVFSTLLLAASKG
jgi:hypothetical protein